MLRALVTGAGTRLGAAIAQALGARGAHVAVHYHSSRAGAEAVAQAIAACGGRATPIRADLTSRDAARELVASAERELGGLDALVASAAGFERVPLDDVDDAAFDRSLSLNLSSQFALAHAARAALRATRGSITFITCSSATVPFKNHLPYVVAKGALAHLTRVLALELAPDVRVNAVAPGTVLPPAGYDAAALARLRGALPLGRFGDPGDVARAVLYLVDSPFVTGQELAVDGGRALARSESFG